MAHTHATRSRAGRHVRHHPRPFVWGGCRRRWTSMYMCLSSTDEPFPTVRKVSNQGRGGARPLSPRFLHWARRVLAFYLPTEAHAGCQLFSQRSPRKSILIVNIIYRRATGGHRGRARTNKRNVAILRSCGALIALCLRCHARGDPGRPPCRRVAPRLPGVFDTLTTQGAAAGAACVCVWPRGRACAHALAPTKWAHS